MPDIGYYTIPVIASMKGITGQVQDDLNKAFKTAGTDAGKIMVQSAADTFSKDPSLTKAIQTAPAAMDAITKSTDKQTTAVTKLRTEEKKLNDVRGGTPEKQIQNTNRTIAAENKVTQIRTTQVTQVKQAKTAHDELAQSIKKVNDEAARTKDIATGTGSSSSSGGTGLVDKLKNDLNKALGGDTSGAASDLGNQLGKTIGTKIGTTLRDTVQDVTGSSVDQIVDKVKGAGEAIGVDVGGAVTKAISGDKGGAFRDIGEQIGAKVGSTISGQVKGLTGIDLGNQPGSLIQQYAPGAAGAVADWAGSGGVGDTLNWLKSGGLHDALGALDPSKIRDVLQQPGGIRGVLGAGRDALGNIDPSAALDAVNGITGGALQPITDLTHQVHQSVDDTQSLLNDVIGGTAAERFIPRLMEGAGPVAASVALTGPTEDLLNKIPWIQEHGNLPGSGGDFFKAPFRSAFGDFMHPSRFGKSNQYDRNGNFIGDGSGTASAPNSIDTLYNSVFPAGGGGGSTSTTAEEVQVQTSDATIMAANVTIAGGANVALPSSLTGGASRPSSLGSAGSNAGTGSLYGGDSGGAYFAMGGGPQGTDIVPAWLTPGEIVVDKPTSDRVRQLFGSGAGYYAGGTGPGGAQVDTKGAQVDTIAITQAIQSMFGVGNVGMYRPPDGFNEHSSGEAADIMVGSNKALGDQIAQWALGHASQYGVQYVLWQQRQWNPNGTSSPMGDRGGPTQNHMDHVHIRTAGGGYPPGGGPGAAGAGSMPGGTSNTPAPGTSANFNINSGGAAPGAPGLGPGGGGSAGGLGGLLSGAGGGDLMGNLSQIGGIGKQALSDTLGLGTLLPDPTQSSLVQAGMAMLQAMFGMSMQQGGLMGALTSDAAGKRTFGAGAMLAGGSPFGMIPQVAGMPHPDDMPSSPGDAAFGDVLSTRIGGGETPHVDNSQHVTVNGFSAQEVGNQVYRNMGQTGVPNNTPRMNTNMPVGG